MQRAYRFILWTTGLTWGPIGLIFLFWPKSVDPNSVWGMWGTPVLVGHARVMISAFLIGVPLLVAWDLGRPRRHQPQVYDVLGKNLRFVLLTGLAIYLAVLFLSIAMPVFTGIAVFDANAGAEDRRVAAAQGTGADEAVPVSAEQLRGRRVLARVVWDLVIQLFVGALFTLALEWGWRGIVLIELRKLGFRRAALMSGLAWAVWPLPAMVFGSDWSGARALVAPATLIALYAVQLCAIAVVQAWAFFRTGDLFASALVFAGACSAIQIQSSALEGPSQTTVILIATASVLVLATAALIWPPRWREPVDAGELEAAENGLTGPRVPCSPSASAREGNRI